ncbi:MAG: hypothetical protein V4548_13930 [Bacteroidota bacterium]
MIKKLIVPAFLLFSLFSFAQEGTSSPYSFYGIGDVKFKGTVDNKSMGGLTVFSDSIHINFQNPASYPNLKLTSFSIAGTYLTTKFKTSDQQENARRTGIDYLAVAVPAGKLGFGFGLIPYSSVGYKIKTITETPPAEERRYSGSGGLNKAFLGFGYAITPKLNVGLDVSYNFGKIVTNSLRFVDEVQFGSRERNESNITGSIFTAGFTYKTKFKKLPFFASLTFSPQSNLKSTNDRKIATLQYTLSGAELVVDESTVDVANTTIKLPSKLAFGAGIGQSKKWMLGAEITMQQSSNFGNRFNDIDNIDFKDAIKYNIGGYFIPNYNSYSSYFSRVVYRGGLRYENTGLVINGKSINDMGVTFGLGLPLPGAFSNINIGAEFGKRGTTNAGLVQENYLNLSIGLSLNDKWFVKRLYN